MKAVHCSWQVRRSAALENGVMIDGSVAITVLDRIRGHTRIRHRLSIPIPNVVLTYEWQITRASPHPYLILWCTRIIFFVMYVPLCIMRLHVESYLRLKSPTRESNIFNTYIFYRPVLVDKSIYKFCRKGWFRSFFQQKRKFKMRHCMCLCYYF